MHMKQKVNNFYGWCDLNPILDQLADIATEPQDLESFVRPLLELMQAVTGLESTYLTRIDEGAGEQAILFSNNTQTLKIWE